MLSVDPVHQNTGGNSNLGTGATITVTLAGEDVTTAGNTVFVYFTGGHTMQGVAAAPSGWLQANVAGGSTAFRRGPTQGLADGESSWDFVGNGTMAGPVAWIVLEFEGLDDGNEDVVGSPIAGAASGTTLASSVTGLTSTYDGVAIAVHCSMNNVGTTPDVWSGHTNGFTELAQAAQAGSSTAVTISVSALLVQRIGTYSTTATNSRIMTAAPGAGTAYTVVWSAEGARRAANVNMLDGAEHGLVTGNTLGPANFTILATATAGVSVSATAKRSGNFGWLLTSAAAACNFTRSTFQAGSAVHRLHFRFDVLPSADAEFWTMGNCYLRYVAATGKISITIGTGTAVESDQAITVDQWFGIDLYRTTTQATWAVDYNAELSDTTVAVPQTQATGSAGTSNAHRVGWTAAITATMWFDDWASSADVNHYPLGDIRVLPLKVDPAGTPTINGTSTNFGVMTANGTVAAWNAVNARNAVDDIPPDLSATRDAAVAVLAHASDTAQFPMETIDLATLGVYIRGVRWLACIWAASATTATIRIRIYDGNAAAEISGAGLSEQDPGADNTATPVWACGMAKPSSGRIDWTQAKLDALAFRFGSNDATPDIGIDAVVFEVAVVKAKQEELIGSAGDPIHVTVGRDPDTNAIIDMDATTVGAGATVDYELDTVPQAQIVVAADDTEHRDIGGQDFQSVNRIDVTPE